MLIFLSPLENKSFNASKKEEKFDADENCSLFLS
jgi:hypothetical protein